MSTLALMRWLEQAPERYDRGMALLTLGRSARLHDAAAEAATACGSEILEIGCGTGAVTARLATRGAHVIAIDQSPEMLDQARARRFDAVEDVEWRECVAAEIDALPVAHFDAVVASFCLSEMSPSERAFVLRESARRLRPGGRLVVADEVSARGSGRRGLQRVLRFPQSLLAWLLAGSTSHPIPDLASEVAAAGLRVVREQRWLGGTLALIESEAAS